MDTGDGGELSSFEMLGVDPEEWIIVMWETVGGLYEPLGMRVELRRVGKGHGFTNGLAIPGSWSYCNTKLTQLDTAEAVLT